MRERSLIQEVVRSYEDLRKQLADVMVAFELARESDDGEFISELKTELKSLTSKVQEQEFKVKMSGRFDHMSALIEFNSGSGGTEAQDWALMLMRMYIRWAERKGFKIEELDFQAGEGAGIKSAVLYIEGTYAYGHLRSESGVHRLVRISPFDSNARRHTSFASVLVSPDVEEDIDIVINEADLKIDTYRASGAGGQHVNKTDSAVRLTHIPSGIVVACQNERSQHKNKARAMKVLKAKLYELEEQKRLSELNKIKGERKKIDFGSQIRSYVMHPYQLVKDIRTECQSSDVSGVLDGKIDAFIEAYLFSAENI